MLEARGAREISQTKTTRMHQMRVQTRTALGMRWKSLKMQLETSEIVERSSRCRTHRLRSKFNPPSLQMHGKGLALEKMHRGTRHLEVRESGDKALGANERVAVSVEGEMAANGNGDL